MSQNIFFIMLITFIWVMPWKGVALWRAAKNGHKYWFVIMLILQTLAVLEIIYILFISKRQKKFEENKNQTDVVSS